MREGGRRGCVGGSGWEGVCERGGSAGVCGRVGVGIICFTTNFSRQFQEMSSEGGFRTVSVLEVPVSYNLARIEVACIANSLHREKKTFKTIRIQSKIYSDPISGGSGMFIPDSGSEFFPSRIPDPHQRI